MLVHIIAWCGEQNQISVDIHWKSSQLYFLHFIFDSERNWIYLIVSAEEEIHFHSALFLELLQSF